MTILSPLIDITSLLGVESLFRPKPGDPWDPWGPELAGRLADIFIYSDNVRYPMPVSKNSASSGDLAVPKIVTALKPPKEEEEVFLPRDYAVAEKIKLGREHLEETFQNYKRWAQRPMIAKRLKQLLQLHYQPSFRAGHDARVPSGYVFDVGAIDGYRPLLDLEKSLGVDKKYILHGFDMALRYGLYAEFAEEAHFFFAHPVRQLKILPKITEREGPLLGIAVSFSHTVREMAPKMTMDEYTSFLLDARRFIQTEGFHTVDPGQLNLKETREIAKQLKLPARLSAQGAKFIAATAAVITLAGSAPIIGATAGIAGGLVYLASDIWEGRSVWRRAAQISWLQWAYKYELEKEASDYRTDNRI